MCLTHDRGTQEELRLPAVVRLTELLVLALTNSRIYSEDHPRVRDALEELARALEEWTGAEGGRSLTLGAADGCLFHDGRPLLAASRSAPRLLEVLRLLEAGGIRFGRGVDGAQLAAFFRFLHSDLRAKPSLREAQERLRAAGCRDIEVLAGYVAPTGGVLAGAGAAGNGVHVPLGATVSAPELAAGAVAVHEAAFSHLVGAATCVLRGHTLDLDGTREIVERILKRLSESAPSMHVASHYETTDADQFQFRHSIRVACLALDFLRHFTNDPELLLRVGTAALLHDVGKARVPFEVLHCRTRLDEAQLEEMRRHPDHGGRILLELGERDALAVTVAVTHHHLPDGRGYPAMRHPLAPEQISTAAHVVRICDVYEALTGYRPYRAPVVPARAYEIMLDMPGHFDLSLLHRFIRTQGVYPSGSRVELESGAFGRVEQQGEDLLSPLVVGDDGVLDPATHGRILRIAHDAGAREPE